MKGKTIRVITTVSVANTLLFSMITSPIYASAIKEPQDMSGNKTLIQAHEASEKVVVESRSKSLVFTVAGYPGRHCAVIAKSRGRNDLKDFKILDNTKTIIGPAGVATMTVDMKDALDRKIRFSVLTSSSPDFKTDLRGTKPVEIQISSRQLSEIKQIRGTSSHASAAAACFAAASIREVIGR
jgi:hypothetical protein